MTKIIHVNSNGIVIVKEVDKTGEPLLGSNLILVNSTSVKKLKTGSLKKQCLPTLRRGAVSKKINIYSHLDDIRGDP